MNDKAIFLKEAQRFLSDTYDELQKAGVLDLKRIDPNRACLVLMDVNNGFLNKGALQSDRVKEILPAVLQLNESAKKLGIDTIAITDAHPENAVEFEIYPPHCLQGEEESQVVAEILAGNQVTVMPKNSTNAFVASSFSAWFEANREKDHFIIVGDCTDICILQFALTLKAYFNEKNVSAQISVIVNGTQTFDAPWHPGDFWHVVSLKLLKDGGIQVFSAAR